MAFNFDVDVKELVEGFNQATENTENKEKEFEKVPYGTYMVKIERLKLEKTKSAPVRPIVRVWFRIVEGKENNRMIFMNQLVDTNQKMGIFKGFLMKLESGIQLGFDGNWDKFSAMLDNILQEIEDTVEYELDYGQNAKGYDTFYIKGAYDAQ